MHARAEGRLHRGLTLLDRLALPLFSAILLALFALAFGRPAAAWYPAHDWLDSNLVLYALWGRDPGLFDLTAALPGVVGGIPVSALALSDLNPTRYLYIVLDPFTAAAVNEVVARFLGFLGLYLLVSTRVLPDHPYRRIVAAGPAVLFALLPYWPQMAYTIALLPLLILAVLDLLGSRKRTVSWTIVAFYAMVADLTIGGFAVLGFLVVTVLIAAYVRRPAVPTLSAVTTVLFVGFAISNVRAIHLVYFTDFVSHREAMASPTSGWFAASNLAGLPGEWFRVVARGQYHMASGQWGLPIIAVAFAGIVLARLIFDSAKSGQKISEYGDGLARLAAIWLVSLGLIALLGLIYATEQTAVTQFSHILPVRIQLNRVIILFPLLWMLVLAVSMALIIRRPSTLGALVLVTATLLALGQGIWTSHSVLPRLSPYLAEVRREHSSQASSYYREREFSQLAGSMGVTPAETTVVSLGIDPMIAAFNGFKTLDGYVYNYPLEHKHAFRRIIEDELARDPNRQRYFDEWGSRVYLFHADRPDGQLFLDFCAASELGADYVVSSREVPTETGLGLAAEGGDLLAYELEMACD